MITDTLFALIAASGNTVFYTIQHYVAQPEAGLLLAKLISENSVNAAVHHGSSTSMET